ncbi:MAG: GFA family protein, partial [Rhodobacter sp.]|nr:GFA family protein [Rhodobacter sp.]
MTQKLTCHCGAVELEVTLSDGLNTVRRCDCSF